MIEEPQVRTVAVGGRTLAHRELGDGEPLVLLHGLAGSWRWWSPLLRVLAARRRLFLPQLPRPPRHELEDGAFGSWVERWLDAVGLQRADIVAHSLGGMFAAELAALAPHRVGRLALVAPAGIPCRRTVAGRIPPLLGALAGIGRWLPTVVGDAVRTGPVAVAREVALLDRRDLSAELPSIGVPTLLVWGVRDRLVPARLAPEWQRLIPEARLVELPCGHVPMLEAPEALLAALLPFLDG